jgi:hypothetical protein
MSNIAKRSQTSSSTSLLKTILNTPNLPGVLRHMQSFVLVRMVQAIGVEDCEELLEHLAPAQIAPILDEELWRAKRAGEEESFQIDQAMRWLRVWNEIGPHHTVTVLEGLGVEYLATLIIQFADVHELSGVAWDMLNLDGFGSSLEERDSHFRHVYGRFVLQLRTRDTDKLELLFGALDSLWESTPEFLEKALAMCCNRSHQDELDEEKRGRGKVHEVEEILRDNLSKSREERRKRLGFLSPDHARDMLQRCRNGEAAKSLRSFLVEHSLWVPETTDDNEEEHGMEIGGDCELESACVSAARNLETAVLAATTQVHVPVFLLAARAEDARGDQRPLQKAVGQAVRSGASAQRIQMEIAGLANLLLSGCNVVGKRFEEKEAFGAVIAAMELGLRAKNERGDFEFPEDGVLGAFQAGMARLQREVALEVAGVLDELVRSRHPDHAMLRHAFVETCIRKEPSRTRFYALVKEGRFFELSRLFSGVEKSLPASVAFAFRCLMAEFPVMPQMLESGEFVARSSREWRHFSAEKDFDAVKSFLKRLPGVL